MKTVVFQSYRTEEVPDWIGQCLARVRLWAEARGWAYRFYGDEALDRVPPWYRSKAGHRLPVVTDLARLLLARELLQDTVSGESFERAVWLDADLLVFDAERLDIDAAAEFAFGREIWVQENTSGGLRTYRSVHNAVCVFCRGNSFLDFYIDACQSVVRRYDGDTDKGGGLPNQIVGTKLLSALHNIIGFPLIETVGMFSPLVLEDVVNGGGAALDLLRRQSPVPPAAANLCHSLSESGTEATRGGDALAGAAVEALLADGRSLFSSARGDR